MEAIAEAQAEEKRQTEIDASSIHRVTDAVADRILTSGGNRRHSIERIVAFFQKDPSTKDAAAFLEKEYGVGGKGLTVARTKYSMWFDERGVHICPGNNTYGTIFTHLPWSAAAVRISQLLKDGMFASQEKIDTARENELDSLANRLADLRMEFSDAAKEKDYLHTVSEAYQGSRSEECVLRIKELLREPESRRRVLSELRAFSSFYVTDRSLLEHRPTTSLPELTRQIADLDTGDPRIKEKMELDIQVAKLKMLKANHMAQKYEMEDMVIKHYPQKMAEAKMFIRALTEDMQIRDMHPVKDDAFSMTIRGRTYTERKAAGEAILAACKSMTEPDKPLDLGQFRGFPMQLQLKGEKFVVTMKQNLTYTAELADEPLGNVVRINNALEKIAENLEKQKRGLVTLEGNLENAKEEAARPFPQEEELAVKLARLSELNAELDNDGKERDQGNAAEPGQEDGGTPPQVNSTPPIAEGDKPSIRAALKSYTPPVPVAAGAEKSHRREAAL